MLLTSMPHLPGGYFRVAWSMADVKSSGLELQTQQSEVGVHRQRSPRVCDGPQIPSPETVWGLRRLEVQIMAV